MRSLLELLEKSPGTAWFQVRESNGGFEARKEFHGCGRISVCGVWFLGLSKLPGPSCKPVRLQTLKRWLLSVLFLAPRQSADLAVQLGTDSSLRFGCS